MRNELTLKENKGKKIIITQSLKHNFLLRISCIKLGENPSE